MSVTDREAIITTLEKLSPESVQELQRFVDYLRYKEERQIDWFEKAYNLFAPVREAAMNMDPDEIDAIIDEAIAEVRGER